MREGGGGGREGGYSLMVTCVCVWRCLVWRDSLVVVICVCVCVCVGGGGVMEDGCVCDQ